MIKGKRQVIPGTKVRKKQGLQVNLCVGGGVQEEPYCLTEAEALYGLENRTSNLGKEK